MNDFDMNEDPIITSGLRQLAAGDDISVDVKRIASRARGTRVRGTHVGIAAAAALTAAVLIGPAAGLLETSRDPAIGSIPTRAAGTEAPAPTPAAAAVSLTAVNRPAVIRELSTDTREVFHFASLGEMVATSTLVVEADVQSIKPGREIVVDSDQKLEVVEVTLRVSRVFVGNPVETVVVEEDGVLAAKSNPNDAGIYFLMEKRDQPGVYRLASSAGRYRVDASGKLHGSNPENALATSLEKLSLDQLRRVVSDAAEAVENGEYSPVLYPTPEP